MWHTSATPSVWTCFTPKKMKVCFLVPLKSFGLTVAVILSVLLEVKGQREMLLVQQKFTLSPHSPWTHPVFALPRNPLAFWWIHWCCPVSRLQAALSSWKATWILACLFKPGVQGYVAVPAQSPGMLQLENQAAFLYTAKTLYWVLYL